MSNCNYPDQKPNSHAPIAGSTSSTGRETDLQSILSKQLGPEYLSTRPGAGGSKLTYIEGWRVIALANEVFGYDGWSSETKSIEVDFVDQNPDGRFNVGVSAVVKITIRKSGNFHEDVGYGKLENSKSKADALDKCKKEAVTDALKRTIRNFGNLLGNCLYNKDYLNNIKTMQAQKEKFMPSKLYRPEHIQQGRPSTSDVKVEKNVPETKREQVQENKKVVIPAKIVSKPPISIPSKPVPQTTETKNPDPVIPEDQSNLTDKRKFHEEEEEQSLNNDDELLPPLAATLSAQYFELDEADLAELEQVETSCCVGQSGQSSSSLHDESDLVIDTTTTINEGDSSSTVDTTIINTCTDNKSVPNNKILPSKLIKHQQPLLPTINNNNNQNQNQKKRDVLLVGQLPTIKSPAIQSSIRYPPVHSSRKPSLLNPNHNHNQLNSSRPVKKFAPVNNLFPFLFSLLS
ncbi:hypothetical protein H4Q26_016893 [Puccinia striiformis f. sp. tritici PST-130]|nr:hypothetical protein H4Q26_016893 [Puccinia striiformis f. sp. tritici PST-130]